MGRNIFVLNEVNSVANHFLSELRDTTIQKDSQRFRKNLERLGEVLAYEISKKLTYKNSLVSSPLGVSNISLLKEQPVLLTILRAGLPFFQGFSNFFDKAQCGFIGAFRGPYDVDHNFEVSMSYLAVPEVDGKTVIMIDPMLATGKSLVKAINEIVIQRNPQHIHIACAIAAPEGIAYIHENVKGAYSLWIGAIDEKLDNNFYIVPGLGDAGDLSYGSKI